MSKKEVVEKKEKKVEKPEKVEKPQKEEKKIFKKAPKKKEVAPAQEEHPAFETREDIKKLYLYTIIVPRGQSENIIRLLKPYKNSAYFIQYGEGTASNAIKEILGSEDTKKDIIFSIVREDMIPDIKKELDIYFVASKRNRGIAYTIQLTSIVGVKLYKFLTQTVRG